MSFFSKLKGMFSSKGKNKLKMDVDKLITKSDDTDDTGKADQLKADPPADQENEDISQQPLPDMDLLPIEPENINTPETDHLTDTDRESENNQKPHKIKKPTKKIDIAIPFFSEQKNKDLALKINAIQFKVLAVILGALVLLIIVSIIILTMIFSAINKSAIEKNSNIIEQPGIMLNSTNFIFIKLQKPLNDEKITLVKMCSDSLATIFYFDNNFNMNNHSFNLIDNNGEVYAVDSSFMNEAKEENTETTIRFEPLKEGVKSFELSIIDIVTKDSATFNFTFEKEIIYPPAKFLNTPIDIIPDSTDIQAKIYGAQFSSTGSTIYFGFQKNSDNVIIRFDEDNTNSLITMSDTFGRVKPLRFQPSLYEFDTKDNIMGSMDFGSVKNLNGKVKIYFQTLYKDILLNQEIKTTELFKNTRETQQTIRIGKYELVLERAGIVSSSVALVLHMKDTTISDSQAEANQDTYNRIQVDVDATLRAKTNDGEEITIEGKSSSMQIGTNVFFSTKDFYTKLAEIPVENYKITINSLSLKLNDVAVSLDLKSLDSSISDENQAILESIQNSFESRLAYRSNEKSLGEIQGFSKEIIDNAQLMQNYKLDSEPQDTHYSVQVDSYSIDTNSVYAVVSEVWKGIVDDKEIHFYRTHKITAQKNDSDWVIVYDEII